MGRMEDVRRPRIVIIGAGFSGLCLGIRLKQQGIDSFTILEQAGRLGGTWRENVYPGAACDLMWFAYCFSFEQKTDWSRKWSPQPEILDYFIGYVTTKEGVQSDVLDVLKARLQTIRALMDKPSLGMEDVTMIEKTTGEIIGMI